MVRRDAGWKRHDRQIFDWSILLIGGLIAVVSLYQWLHGSYQHAILAFGLTAWIAVYFTNYWQPILYLIAALVLFSVTLVWVWRGTWDDPLNQIGIVSTSSLSRSVRTYFGTKKQWGSGARPTGSEQLYNCRVPTSATVIHGE